MHPVAVLPCRATCVGTSSTLLQPRNRHQISRYCPDLCLCAPVQPQSQQRAGTQAPEQQGRRPGQGPGPRQRQGPGSQGQGPAQEPGKPFSATQAAHGMSACTMHHTEGHGFSLHVYASLRAVTVQAEEAQELAWGTAYALLCEILTVCALSCPRFDTFRHKHSASVCDRSLIGPLWQDRDRSEKDRPRSSSRRHRSPSPLPPPYRGRCVSMIYAQRFRGMEDFRKMQCPMTAASLQPRIGMLQGRAGRIRGEAHPWAQGLACAMCFCCTSAQMSAHMWS